MPKGKTLVEGIRKSSERSVEGLRTYEAPPDVKVFKVNPNNPTSWDKLSQLAIPIRTEPPTQITYSFNNHKVK
jgi:hypothetical protein